MVDNILDEMIRREVQLQRFATFMVREYVDPTAQQIGRELSSFLVGYEDLSAYEQRELVRRINQYVGRTWGGVWVGFNSQLDQLKQNEADFMLDLYDEFTPENEELVPVKSFPSMNIIMSVNSRAGVWANFTQANQDDTVRAVNAIVQGGIRDGATVQSMVKQVRGSYNRRTKKYSGGVLTNAQAKRAESLVRTGTNHHVNAVRDRFAKKNKNVIEKRIFFATLDDRTTTICFANHLREWTLDDDKYPRLPLHFNERSVYIFKTKGFNPLNVTRPAKGGGIDEGSLEVEMIQARTTANAWLKRQPRWFVEQSLGKGRAELFIDGGLKIESMVDVENRPLTLSQLAETTAGRRASNRIGNP
jgi:hypothetical protein